MITMRIVEPPRAPQWALAPFLVALCVAFVGTAQAATYTVNSLNDVNDSTCDVTHCSLRDAVELATVAADRIVFDFSLIGGSAPFEIELDSNLELPETDVTIDGLDCTGCGSVGANTNDAADGFNSSLAVRIVPSGSFPASTTLLTVSGTGITVIGLNVDGSTGDGIDVTGADASIQDCYVGTSITGQPGSGNALRGIQVTSAASVDILNCLVSGNGSDGILIEGGTSDDPLVQANIVGLSVDASTADGNGNHGIYLRATSDLDRAIIGGLTVAEGNVVSGNGGDGIRFEDKVDGLNVTYNLAFGIVGNNVVGTDGAVTVARPNVANGLAFEGSSGGGNEPRNFLVIDNVFSGNGAAGILMQAAKENTFHGNAIGTDLAATQQLGNTAEGIYLRGGPSGDNDTKQMVIGGVGLENLIAYNGGDGIRMHVTGDPDVKQNTINANSIHTNGGIGVDSEQASAGDGGGAPPANSCADDGTWGNKKVGSPLIASANLLAGALTITGTSCASARVDVYLADGDASGYGEPMTYLDTTTAVSTSWSVTTLVTGIAGIGGGAQVTALQTDAQAETSEAAFNVVITAPCDADGDGYDNASGGQCAGPDCDDSLPNVYPGATEVCDGLDTACAGSIPADEADADGDGVIICEGDCDDTNATVNDLATEICDGLDTDCSGSVPTDELDGDGDGMSPCAGDCNDSVPTIYLGALEFCNNIDDDCNGLLAPREIDDDGDGDNECADGDCDDTDSTIFVGAVEVCDGVDEDCDTIIDDGFDADGDGVTVCGPDGIASNADDDCDDNAIATFPGGTDVPDDGIDQDCSGTDTITCFQDLDGDTFGSLTTVLAPDGDCSDSGESLLDTDCDDAAIAVFPGQTEVCNGVDDDCSGSLESDEADADSDGEMTCAGDCDDANAAVNTGATEVCNLIDDDCDSSTDEGFNADGDSFTTCGADGVSGTADDDCDDSVGTIFPGAVEVCDIVDQDCDSVLDNGFDTDGDGVTTCGPDGVTSNTDDDCDDTSPSVFPSAPEIADDGIDQDCDGNDTITCFVDVDLDGVGTAATVLAADGDCTDSGESLLDTDCDDTEITVFPGATELCNGIDEDCDVAIDEDLDADGDTFPIGASCTVTVDCDDTNAAINPAATEVCDTVDNNCNGQIDEEVDGDGDGYTGCAGDCDDNDATINPGATELCDGADTDCDGTLPSDELDLDGDNELPCAGDCNDANAAVNTSATEVCNIIDDDCDGATDQGFDLDGDGVTTCGGDGAAGTADDDCDDGNATVLPGATELCNAIDDDCDAAIDEGFDADTDGVTTCGPDGLPSTADDDCDDTLATVFPGATDLPDDGIDQDCSGADTVTCYVDLDADGFGTSALLAVDGDCTDPDEAPSPGDCDDGAPAVFPGQTELCNGVDEDCDGSIDEDFDADGDGYPIGASCSVTVDCDDTNAAVNPAATEICDSIDNNCNGDIDEEIDSDGDTFTGCDGDCDDNDATSYPGATELCDGLDNDCDGAVPSDETDDDGDGFTECGDADCDDTDPLVFVGQTEACTGVDDDCDGDIDEDQPDDDADGFDDCQDGDCDDDDDLIFPGQTELCDGIDEDCDGDIDNGFDADEDGVTICGPDGIAGNADDDCDDADPDANPEATELCDGIDNDCDGDIDEEADDDADGFTNCDGDCDDADADVYPGADELCDGVDNDCDEVVPGDELDADGDGTSGCEGDCDDEAATVFVGADEICGDDIDQDCDGDDPVCPGADADVTLGEVPEGCAGCATEGRARPGPLLLLFGLGLVQLRRRL